MAAHGGKEALVTLLLDAGADVDSPSLYLSTPLHVAADELRFGVISLLIDAGADVDAVNARDRATPLSLAIADKGGAEATRILISRQEW